MTKAEFIRQQLSKLALVDFEDPEQAKIVCPFHDDSNPSLDVRLAVKKKVKDGKLIHIGIGTFNCWSCQTHGPWNMLAQKLGLEFWDQEKEDEYADRPDDPFWQMKADLKKMEELNIEHVPPVSDGPWEGPWRGLTGAFLRSRGAESSWDDYAGEYRILLPMFDAFGKRIGEIRARADGSKIPDNKKYLNNKGLDAASFWYGLNFIQKPDLVVVVEGPYDMLRLQSENIPAVAVLGLNAISDAKVMQLIARGCRWVILCLDADKHGRNAMWSLGKDQPGYVEIFQRNGLQIFDMDLRRYRKDPDDEDEKIDPGSGPQEMIADLNAFILQVKTSG